MASGQVIFNGLTMSRASSRDSLSSEIIDLDVDHSGSDAQQHGTHNETGSYTRSNTPVQSLSSSTSPTLMIPERQQGQNIIYQQQSEQNLNTGAKNKKLFPQKLWDLINDERYSFCLRWSDDGQLVYLNRDEFEDSYLKTTENQFHTQKAISFVRQMNMYGFRKVDDCYYENDNFKRGCEHLLKNMVRKHPNKNNCGMEITAQMSLNTSLVNYRQRQRPEADSMNQSGANSHQVAQQQVIDDSDASDDGSLSSLGNPCCNIGINQGAAMKTVQPSITSEGNMTYDGRLCNMDLNSNNTSAVYALLSSLNANLYQAGMATQQQLGATQNTDFEHFMNLQQLYRQILTTQTNDGTQSAAFNQKPIDDSSKVNSQPKVSFDQQAINYSSPSNRSCDISPRSILARETVRAAGLNDQTTLRRDSNPIRSFKRSANSILESRSPGKRARNDFSRELDVDEVVTASYARGLVTRIAQSRDPNIEPDVIEEASRYTERFVETLFDTAQLMACHDVDDDCSSIKSSNLSSALRLMPSKLSKIFQ